MNFRNKDVHREFKDRPAQARGPSDRVARSWRQRALKARYVSASHGGTAGPTSVGADKGCLKRYHRLRNLVSGHTVLGGGPCLCYAVHTTWLDSFPLNSFLKPPSKGPAKSTEGTTGPGETNPSVTDC